MKLGDKQIELMAIGITSYLKDNGHHTPQDGDDINTAFVIIVTGLIEEIKAIKKRLPPESNIILT